MSYVVLGLVSPGASRGKQNIVWVLVLHDDGVEKVLPTSYPAP